MRRLLRQPWLMPLTVTVAVPAMMVWLGDTIIEAYRDLQLHSVAESGETFINGFLVPTLNDHLDPNDQGSGLDGRIAELAEHFPEMGDFSALRIWATDGSLIYSNPPAQPEGELEQVHVFDPTDPGVVAELTIEPPANGHTALPAPFTEVYAPVRDPASGRTIAVVEIYQDATELLADRASVERSTWAALLLATAGLLTTLALSIRQCTQLRANLRRERLVTEQNAVLRREAEEAQLEATLINEQVLNLVGAEIHDGPIQMLGLAVLMEGKPGSGTPSDGVTVRNLLTDVLQQLREISDGLILPELKDLSTTETVNLAVARHTALTGTTVATDLGPLPAALDEPRKICLYRVVQEGLTNAYRHAGGRGQALSCHQDGDAIHVRIGNDIDATPATSAAPSGSGLGQRGMRKRLDAFGGSLGFERKGGRATLRAVLPVGAMEPG